MKTIYIGIAIACLLLTGACFLCTDHLILSLVIGASFLLALSFGLAPMFLSFAEKSRGGHECYRFINAYVISLSATSSLEKAFASAGEGSTGKLLTTMESVAQLGPYEKVEYMDMYFKSDLYSMFLSVLRLYQDQGGDILLLSNHLLEEVNRVEEASRQKEKVGIRSAFQYILLWLMSLAILVFLRYGLGMFFDSIKDTPVYLISVAIFFLFMLVSILIYGAQFAGDFRRKWKKEAKEGKA